MAKARFLCGFYMPPKNDKAHITINFPMTLLIRNKDVPQIMIDFGKFQESDARCFTFMVSKKYTLLYVGGRWGSSWEVLTRALKIGYSISGFTMPNLYLTNPQDFSYLPQFSFDFLFHAIDIADIALLHETTRSTGNSWGNLLSLLPLSRASFGPKCFVKQSLTTDIPKAVYNRQSWRLPYTDFRFLFAIYR